MPRPRKCWPGDVVIYHQDNTESGYAVVVGYRQDGRGRGDYRLVRVTRPLAGQTYGHTFWLKSYRVDPVGTRYTRAVSVVRANDRLGPSKDRGCSCQCCAHTAISLSMVRADGSLAWEHDDATIEETDEQEVPSDDAD